MSIQDTLVTDQEAIDAAIAKLAADSAADQAILDAAQAVLVADQAKLDALQPHLTLLAQLEKDVSDLVSTADASMQGALNTIKTNIDSFIAQARTLFLG